MKNTCIFLLLALGLCGTYKANAQKDPAVYLTGSLGAGLTYYNINGADPRQNPYGYMVNGQVTVHAGQLSLPFSVYMNQQGTSFSQPFNRFGFSPSYKWATLHLGHRMMYFNPFTLSGTTFLGAGIELNPGIFRFSAMYGQFQPAIDRETANFGQPQFRQTGYASKIGVGNDKNYIDLIFFQAADDRSSLDLNDSIENAISAQQNTAIGLSGRFELLDGKLSLKADGGVSIFTRNQGSPAVEVGTTGILQNIVDFISPNISTNVAGAGSAEMAYREENFNLALEYRYVEEEYRTLGLNYLIDDLEQITVKPGVRLFGNRLVINGSYGIQNNNLNDRRAAKTTRNIGSLNISWMPNQKFFFSGGYSNFSIYQSVVIDSILNDSLLVDQVNHNINGMARYMWTNEKFQQSISLTANFQTLADNNDFTSEFTENRVFNNTAMYQLTNIKRRWTITGGAHYILYRTTSLQNTRIGIQGQFNQSLLKSKLNVAGGVNVSRSISDMGNGWITNLNTNVNYRVAQRQSLSFRLFYIVNDVNQSFSELRGSIAYRIGFDTRKSKRK